MQFTPEQQRENLAKLADFLENGIDFGFGMGTFETIIDPEIPIELIKADWSKHPEPCGTVRCACGCGPIALGIPRLVVGLWSIGDDLESWGNYAYRVWGIRSMSIDFSFLFSSSWVNRDNTIKGAVTRIRYYLKSGSPEATHYYNMIDGEIPLYYYPDIQYNP